LRPAPFFFRKKRADAAPFVQTPQKMPRRQLLFPHPLTKASKRGIIEKNETGGGKVARICILTEDARLRRMLALLVEEAGHTVSEDSPVLLLTDTDNLPPHLCNVKRLKIGEGALARPFSHEVLLGQLARSLSESPLPVLTPTERRLFDALMAASPAPVDRGTLARLAFGTEEDGGRLNLYICYLRKKIETDGKKRIFACRGKGYYYADTAIG
jgi:hypothetical protein